MEASDVCLVTPIEQNKTVVCWDGKPHKRWFEDEAVRMAQSWRKNGGWLKDIPIYVFNVNGAVPNPSTISSLTGLGCIYIDASCGNYEDMGFLTEPLCGKLAEETVSEEYIVKIDLDMQLTKPVDRSLVEKAADSVLIEQYTDRDTKQQRTSLEGFNPFDTCFIIARKSYGFFEKYNSLCSSREILENPVWKSIEGQSGKYFLEEFVVDYMFKSGRYSISPMRNHIYGEGYGDIDEMEDSEVSDMLFLHSHIYKFEPPIDGWSESECRTKYAKRMCSILRRRR